MFGRMMNNYYYGKSGKGDYHRSDLPQNRRQLFWEMLRVRFSGLFRLNLLSVIAFLPLMFVVIKLIGNLYTLMSIVAEVQRDPTAASPEYLQVYQHAGEGVYRLLFTAFLYLIPCIAITGPFQAGMAYVTRNWARDEHAFVWSDFKDAFLANWKQALGVSVITGFVPFIMLVCWRFYGDLAKGSMLYIVPQMLTLMICLVWMLSLTFLYPMLISYELKFSHLIKNSLLLAVGRLPQVVAARLAMLVPTIIVALVAVFTPYGLYAMMMLAGYYVLLGNGLARFVYASFSNAVFDRFINAKMQGVPINRGLATPEDLEEDEDEEDEESETP